LCLPARRGARRCDHGGDRHLGVWVGVGPHLEAPLADREPVRLPGDGLLGGEQGEDGLEALLHHAALLHGVDPHDAGVGRQGAWAGTEDEASAREVVEQAEAVRHEPRVVVGERHHAGSELDVLGALGGRGDEDLGAADDLVAAGVVLTEPGLVVAEAIELGDPFEVVLERQRGALPDRVEGREERAEAQGARGGHVSDLQGRVRTGT
jgi:hypothetical protein